MALTNKESELIMGMLARGDKNHDISAWFGENPARVAEVKDGTHGYFKAANAIDLPPKGAPGLKGRKMYAFAKKSLKALEDGDAAEAIELLKNGIAAFEKHQA